MANIVYIGNSDPGSTSAHRAGALRRLGHTVVMKDPYRVVSMRYEPINHRTGYRLVQSRMQSWAEDVVLSLMDPDLVWVDSGELIGPKCLRILKTLGCPVVLYNVDDPTGGRDGRKFDLLLKALPLYDLAVVVRRETEIEFKSLGAKSVMRVNRSYDEIAHQPFLNYKDIPPAFHSEVVFIGTWMRHEKRDEFLLELTKQKVPISIYGQRWQKSAHWKDLQPFYRGKELSGQDYVAAIQGAKVCIGLLSKGNRDLHTQRTFEIPFAGGLLCAERTIEHQDIFREGVDAVFWSDARECADICKGLLKDGIRRESIRLHGMQHVRAIGAGNEDVCHVIIKALKLSNIPIVNDRI